MTTTATILIRPEGQVADEWTSVATAADLSLVEGPAIVPFDAIDAALAERRNAPLGVHLPNHVAPDAVEPYLTQVALVSVAFPAFSDGRGFSLAKRIRRAGFTGRLRATGPLIADQFADALACGFDEVALPEAVATRQPAEQWVEARSIVRDHYQSGYEGGASILEQRRAAAAAKAEGSHA